MKRHTTRRRTAVKWLVLSALLAGILTGGYRLKLLPVQAFHAAAEQYGLTDLKTVRRGPRLRLQANDDAVLLTYVHPWYASAGAALSTEPAGWACAAFAVDCTPDEPIHAGNLCYYPADYQLNSETETHYVFGRVDDPAVDRLQVARGRIGMAGELQVVAEYDVSTADLLERDGQRYFLLTLERNWAREYAAEQLRLTAYDENGETLYVSRLTHGGQYVFSE